MQSDIPKVFKAALSCPDEPWFSDMSKIVTAVVWGKFAHCGFIPANYDTHRWLKNDPTAARPHFGTLDLGNSLQCRVETLPASSRIRYEKSGLIFLPCVSIKASIPILQSALSFVALVPSLHATVARYLRSLHILQAPGGDYDVSHSDPKVPFSIFVSIPISERERRLRLAESIIHECMHLQLTLIEEMLPLVTDQEARSFSPWLRTLRPLAGVLHGLYVFTVIHTWFKVLRHDALLTPNERAFARKRQDEIAQEATQVAGFASMEGLTNEGRCLARYLNQCLHL